MHELIPVRQVWPDAFAKRYREAGYWTGETFPSFLRQRAAEMPDRLAVVGGDARWTYAELWRRAETAAAGFLSLGLEPGDRVLVQLTNIPEFLSATFGLFRAGLIPVYTLPAHRTAELTHFARKSEAAALIVGPSPDGFDYRRLGRGVQAEVPAVRHVIAVGSAADDDAGSSDAGNSDAGDGAAADRAAGGGAAGQGAAGDGDAGACVSFDAFQPNPAALPQAEPLSSDVVLMQISGGSTGLSKLIPRTHDDYLYSCRASAEICGLGPDSVYLGVLPIAHNFPMSSPGIFGTLYAGGRIVMSPSPSPEVAFGLIERERVTITALVPPLALVWLQAAPQSKADLSSLEVLQVGGAKLMPEAAKRVQPTLGCKLQQVFGMAEGLVNYTRLDDPDEIVVETQGRPISPDDELLILDDRGEPVAEGEPGNLLTRGPYTIRAYHNDDGANARAFTEDGYYRTGDVVRRTPEGYLVVQGRATDHINRAGEKISAEEVEDHLLAHPSVFDAAIVAVPDPYLGERSCAFVIPNGEKPKAALLKAWIRERGLAEFKVPDQIVFVESFRTTAVGKISRKELRAELRERLLER